MDKDKLTQEDVAALMNAAAEAWEKLGPNGNRAAFTWRGQRYIASHTSFRLVVHTLDGKPVAGRYD